MQPSRTVAALLSGLLSVSLQAQDIAASATVLPLDSARLQAMGVELVGVQVTPDYVLTRVPARLQIADTARQSVVAPFAGAILRVAVLEGQVVQPGDVLAEVRSPDWQARLAEAAQREAAWADAKARAERSEALLNAGVISAREAEQARAAWRAATTTRNTMQADSQGIRPISGGYALLATQAGMVLHRAVGGGDPVSTDDVLFEIGDASERWAEARLPARFATQMGVGDAVRVVGEEGLGEVIAVGRAIDPRTLDVSLTARLPEGAALPGQSVELELRHAAPPNTVRLPSAAVVDIHAQHRVFVAAPEGLLLRSVVVLARDGQDAVVTGLGGDERVAARGLLALKTLALEALAEQE